MCWSKITKTFRKLIVVIITIVLLSWFLIETNVFHVKIRNEAKAVTEIGGFYHKQDHTEIKLINDERTCHINEVAQVIKDSQTGSPISEKLQRTGHLMDNLCLLHYNAATQHKLSEHGITIKNLTENEILSKCRLRTENSKSVPNRVFYVIYGKLHFTFMHYLSFLSVHKFVRPDALYLVGDEIPTGEWWDKVRRDIPYVRFVFWPRPRKIFGHNIELGSHASDVVRLQIFLTDGGIYLDTDLLILHPLTPLHHLPLSMGLVDNSTGVGNAFVMAQRATRFLRLWYMAYRNFDSVKNYFGMHSMQVPLRLWQMYPHLINVEQTTIYQPSWTPGGQKSLYVGQYDWSKNYGVHVWHNTEHHIPQNVTDVWNKNSTLAQIVKHILYSPER